MCHVYPDSKQLYVVAYARINHPRNEVLRGGRYADDLSKRGISELKLTLATLASSGKMIHSNDAAYAGMGASGDLKGSLKPCAPRSKEAPD